MFPISLQNFSHCLLYTKVIHPSGIFFGFQLLPHLSSHLADHFPSIFVLWEDGYMGRCLFLTPLWPVLNMFPFGSFRLIAFSARISCEDIVLSRRFPWVLKSSNNVCQIDEIGSRKTKHHVGSHIPSRLCMSISLWGNVEGEEREMIAALIITITISLEIFESQCYRRFQYISYVEGPFQNVV